MTPNSPGGQLNGQGMFEFAQEPWTVHPSIRRDGTRENLANLRNLLPDLVMHEIPPCSKVIEALRHHVCNELEIARVSKPGYETPFRWLPLINDVKRLS